MGKILVNGATEYVGGRLVPELLARGYQVRVMVRTASDEHRRRWPEAKISVADALDPDSLRRTLEGTHVAYYRWKKYPTISQMWRRHWEYVILFFDYPSEIRKVIYTTNAIESLNRSLRKLIKTKGAFSNDASILKIFYLALAHISKKWTKPIRTWKAALSQFAFRF
ncbi:transposase [Planctomycetota bacterium]